MRTIFSYGTKRKNIPNILTVSRLILVFPFMTLETLAWFTHWSLHFVAFGFLFLCLFTDKVDGWLARKYGWVTEWGAKWDPIIDGLVITLVNIYLIVLMIITEFPYAYIFTGFFMIIGFRNYVISQGFKSLKRRADKSDDPDVRKMVEKISHVTKWGKWSTAIQMLAIGLFFLVEGTAFQALTFSVVFAAGFCLSMFSGLNYGRNGWKIAKMLWQKENFPRQRETRYLFKTLVWARSVVKIMARAMPF